MGVESKIEKSGVTGHGPNAWWMRLDEEGVEYSGFSVRIHCSPRNYQGVHEGDLILLGRMIDGKDSLVGVATLYRLRSRDDFVELCFDTHQDIEVPVEATSLGIGLGSSAKVVRLNWSDAEAAVKITTGLLPSSLPLIEDHAHVRDLLQLAVIDDLLGPASGPFEEVVGMSVRDRYLVGKLAPMDTDIDAVQVDQMPGQETGDPEEGGKELDPSTSQSLVPSSFGLTFCVAGDAASLRVRVRWGRYQKGDDREIEVEEQDDKGRPTGKTKTRKVQVWQREPRGGEFALPSKEGPFGPIAPDPDHPQVVVQGEVRPPLPNGDRLVTLFLVNGQPMPDSNQDQAWLFQPEVVIRGAEDSAIFRRRPIFEGDSDFDLERESLRMIYRNRVEFAVGHGVSVHAEVSREDPERAVEVRTQVVPEHEVPVTETPGLESEDRPAMSRMVKEGLLDMKRLASMSRDELISTLEILTNDYDDWIGEQRARSISGELAGHEKSAEMALDKCSGILGRLREGIDVLKTDGKALEAFRFANRSMALQRVRSVYALKRRRGEDPKLDELDVPENHSWRPFQLAFILLSLPSLADPRHSDRTESLDAYADLLWFPTGGGKTEAYLGVAAFAMAVRRLQGGLGGLDGSRGLTVIMRYTLRLLTLQQFQRASTLICAMEYLRRKALDEGDDRWGREPFTIGLWVGTKVTPNRTKDSATAVEKERKDKRFGQGGSGTPAQLTSCPWCGSEISAKRDIDVLTFEKDVGRTVIHCSDKYGRCEFSRKQSKYGLPVLVVDEEIYRRPPSMMIATVDKFAMMAWQGAVQTLFGRAMAECDRHGLIWPDSDDKGNHQKKGTLPATKVKTPVQRIRPPDLIIQDEFHLISGPLGTMVGLYETAVDELASWELEGRKVRPKVVASTATVRKAIEQVHRVFLRRVGIFPPHGLEVGDDFFSVQRSITRKPGRRYMGICSPGSSRPAVLIRVYVAFLTASQELFRRFGVVADPYMTTVGYFNSLRELGGMRRLAEDDVQTRAYKVQMSEVQRPGLAQRELKVIEELTSRVSSKEIPKKLDRLEVPFKPTWSKGETRAVDVVLATNMLSVGVDVNRLGLMVVNGQPKTTAEYIQATSRVGRSYPGLVCTVLTWARPRDLSHYESFEHYHATFYQYVEAQSVTPFAPRALDRGLTGTMVSLMRLVDFELNPNEGAVRMDSLSRKEASLVKTVIPSRAWLVTDNKGMKTWVDARVNERLDDWVKEANTGGRQLGYERDKSGTTAPLLKKPSAAGWDRFTVPMSMREVEPGVRLVMDTSHISGQPNWRVKVKGGSS